MLEDGSKELSMDKKCSPCLRRCQLPALAEFMTGASTRRADDLDCSALGCKLLVWGIHIVDAPQSAETWHWQVEAMCVMKEDPQTPAGWSTFLQSRLIQCMHCTCIVTVRTRVTWTLYAADIIRDIMLLAATLQA
jgi:hypothetical protein